MYKLPIFICSVFLLGTSFNSNNEISKKEHSPIEISHYSLNKDKTTATSESIYNTISFEGNDVLNFEVFDKAFTGFQNLKKSGELNADANLLTVVDFSLSSSKKRLWVIDMDTQTIVFNSLVAHGKGTGEEFATNFSNTDSSHQSSLGFYITETTYNGSNGYSLRLMGMDKGFNDAAMRRAIVMHGADYVSEDFIKSQKRLGRSWGCPAVPRALAAPIIDKIKDKSCLFIYYPNQDYLSKSEWLKKSEESPINVLAHQ